VSATGTFVSQRKVRSGTLKHDFKRTSKIALADKYSTVEEKKITNHDLIFSFCLLWCFFYPFAFLCCSSSCSSNCSYITIAVLLSTNLIDVVFTSIQDKQS